MNTDKTIYQVVSREYQVTIYQLSTGSVNGFNGTVVIILLTSLPLLQCDWRSCSLPRQAHGCVAPPSAAYR